MPKSKLLFVLPYSLCAQYSSRLSRIFICVVVVVVGADSNSNSVNIDFVQKFGLSK